MCLEMYGVLSQLLWFIGNPQPITDSHRPPAQHLRSYLNIVKSLVWLTV